MNGKHGSLTILDATTGGPYVEPFKVDYAYGKDQVVAQTKWCMDNANYDSTTKAFQRENAMGCNWTTSKTLWDCVVATDLYDADAPPGLEVRTGNLRLYPRYGSNGRISGWQGQAGGLPFAKGQLSRTDLDPVVVVRGAIAKAVGAGGVDLAAVAVKVVHHGLPVWPMLALARAPG